MTEHILLKLATRKPYRRNPQLPPTAVYNAVRGYWTIDGQPMVSTIGFENGPPNTKKCDQETGEDIKAE